MDYSNYTFFLGMQFSQWYPAKFVIDGIEFKTSEHYMMWCKAKLFKSERIAEMILDAENPDDVRWLGRQIQGFDEETWKANCQKFVYDGNVAKFTQNPELIKILLDTGDTKIVEASDQDPNWGIGLDEATARTMPEEEWPGTNWLGNILTQLREEFKKNYKLSEVERNSRLMNLLIKLNQEKDFESIALLKTLVDNDTPAMKKSFQIMTESTPLSAFFGLKKLSDGFKKQ